MAKMGSGRVSVTKAEAIDAALRHGWIDGQLDKYDDTHWLIRFTPRKARSKWSQVNRMRATEPIEAGRWPRQFATIRRRADKPIRQIRRTSSSAGRSRPD